MQEGSSYVLRLKRNMEKLLVMVNLLAELDSPSSSEQLELPLTREAKQQLNSEFLSSLAQKPDLSTESVPEAEWVRFELGDMTEEDFAVLDAARLSGWYVLTVEEFANDILQGKYDIWKIENLPGCHCIIMTNFEVLPRDKFMNVHFMAGKTVVRHKAQLLKAFGKLMDAWGCSACIFMASNKAYGKRLGGEYLTTLYKFEREALDGKPEERNADHEE
jgi:hypothetical protein